MNDLKFALRQLLKRPGGTLVILGTLTLVIGAMCLGFGVVQHERSAWMPFPQQDRVVRLWVFGKDRPIGMIPAEAYVQMAGQVRGLDAVAAMGNYGSQVLTGAGEARSLSVQHVSASIFAVAGVQPALGRVFTAEEVRAGETQPVVISHGLWKSAFEGSESIIGKEIILNKDSHTIVGVMPEEFTNNGLFQTHGTSVWAPKDFESPGAVQGFIHVVGRRGADVPPDQLNAELRAVALPTLEAVDARRYPAGEVSVAALRADKHPDLGFNPGLVFGIAIPLFVVAIAVLNIATVLLSRMLARRHEFAVRFSLGARRRRVIRHLLGESLLLALIGAALGVVAARLAAVWAAGHGLQVEFSLPVILGTVGLAIAIGIAAGWLPALRATRGDLVADLKESSRSGIGGAAGRHRLRSFLVIGQVSLATALCLGTGLLTRSYFNQQAFEPTFDADRLIQIRVSLNRNLYPEPAQHALFAQQARERIGAIPGVMEVAVSSSPVIQRLPFTLPFSAEGQEEIQPKPRVNLTVISPNYWKTINIPILRGRSLLETDKRGGPPVIVVNQEFVQRYFSHTNPIGARIAVNLEGKREWLTIVGVAADQRDLGRNENHGAEGYVCADQFVPSWVSWIFLARRQVASGGMAEAIKEAIHSVDGAVPVQEIATVSSVISGAIERDRGGAQAIGAISLFGLFMAMLGIYGAVENSVTERTREVGVRMALGADQKSVLILLLGQGMRYTFIGLGIGLLLGAGLTTGLRSSLYGVGPFDVPTYALVAALLWLTALLAMALPARRAARIDPMNALRYE